MWGWAQEYKREEEIYNLYMKTRKWEMYKVPSPAMLTSSCQLESLILFSNFVNINGYGLAVLHLFGIL